MDLTQDRRRVFFVMEKLTKSFFLEIHDKHFRKHWNTPTVVELEKVYKKEFDLQNVTNQKDNGNIHFHIKLLQKKFLKSSKVPTSKNNIRRASAEILPNSWPPGALTKTVLQWNLPYFQVKKIIILAS